MTGDETATGPAGPVERARAYYRALDEDDYDLLESVLAPEFVHERPDVTLSDRDRFVRFMREERPVSDTSHAIDGVYRRDADTGEGSEAAAEIAVRGRLLGPDGEQLGGFVDVFSFGGPRIARIETYVDG